MLTNIKSESNAPFLKSPPLAHKIILFEKSQHLRQKWVLARHYPKWVYSVDLTKTFKVENKNWYFC